jgi:hypothetical protein
MEASLPPRPATAAALALLTLSAAGDPGTRVRGRCVLATAAGERTLELDEAVPFSRRLDGTALRCELEATGSVRVEAAAGGSRSVTSTSGGRLAIAVAG